MTTQTNHWVLLALGLCLFISPANADSETIPDGTAQELLEYVNRQIGAYLPVPDNDAERKEQVEKLERSLKAVNLGLERLPKNATPPPPPPVEVPGMPPRTDLRTELLQKKNFVLWLLNDYAKGYTEMYLNFIAELEANPADRKIAKQARGTYLNELGSTLAYRNKQQPITREAFFDFRKQVLNFLQDDGDDYIQTFVLKLMAAAIRIADQENDRSLANETADLCTTLHENSKEEFNHTLAYRPKAILNKHYLAQDGLIIAGKLFNGEAFDPAKYRGKPMLVVFWRSDPKAGEDLFSPAHASNLVFPKLKELYEQYHSSGLEIVGVCTDKPRQQLEFLEQRDNVPAEAITDALEKMTEQIQLSPKTAGSLPWQDNISEQLTIDAGLPPNEKKYDLWGQYIFFLDADGRIRHQQEPNCADFDSAKAKGVNITGMMGGPMKYLTEELEQKIKDYFSGIEVQFYLGKHKIEDGRAKIVGASDLYRVEGEDRFVALEIANRSNRDLQNVELVIHAPTKQKKVSDAVKTVIPESSGIEKSGDTYRLKVGTLPAGKDATMFLEFEIGYTAGTWTLLPKCWKKANVMVVTKSFSKSNKPKRSKPRSATSSLCSSCKTKRTPLRK